MRWALRILAGLFLLILLTVSSVSALLATVSGSEWLLARISTILNTDSRHFSFRQSEGTFLRGLNLQGVQWRDAGTELQIAQLHSRWNPLTLLEGEFYLESLRLSAFQLNIIAAEQPVEATAPLVLDDLLDSFLPLPVAIRVSNARIDGARITTADTEFNIDLLALSARLQGRSLVIDQLEFGSTPLSLNASLQMQLQRPYPLQLTADWRYDEILLEGTEAPHGQLSLDGSLDQFNLQHSLHGLAELSSAGEITLKLAQLLNADINALEPQFNLEHTLATQPLPGMENYEVLALRLRTQGTPDDLGLFAAAQLDMALSHQIRLDADLNLRAYLRGSVLDVRELAFRTGEGQIVLQGLVDWTDELELNLDYQLTDPAPDSYLAGVPDSLRLQDLSSDGSLSLALTEGQLQSINFNMNSLTAMLNDFPVNGAGGVRFIDNTWHLENLQLRNGNNSLAATATVTAEQVIEAALSIDAPTLSVLYPGLEGRLHADASISGSFSEPVIDMDLSAQQISYGDYVIPELTVTGQNRAGMNELELLSGNIVLPIAGSEETIKSIQLRLRGQPDAHNLLLLADGTPGALRINADGALDAGGWRGRLLSSEVNSAYGNWVQEQSGNMNFSAETLSISPVCWMMVDTRLCLDASLDNQELLAASISVQNFPLDSGNLPQTEALISRDSDIRFPDNNSFRLPQTLPADVALSGLLSASATINGPITTPELMDVQASVQSTAGNLYYIGEALGDDADINDPGSMTLEPVINHFTWPVLRLTANQSAGSWAVDGELQFAQQYDETPSTMQGTAMLAATVNPDRELAGGLRIDFDNLGWLEALTPQLTQVSGGLTGRLSLAGTLQSPQVGGDIMLSQAAFNMPALNLSLSGIELTLTSENSDLLELSGYAESGAGSLNFISRISDPFSGDPSFNVRLAGSEFTIADLPELQVAISPDLQLQGSQQGIDLNGQLHIPLVSATISTLPESAVDVSSDTILITEPGSENTVRNAAIRDAGPLGNIPLSGDLTISLGEQVRIAGFGLNARLRGELDITQRPGATPLSYGELEVAEGNFEIYGRVLTIEQGKLLFMGSYDNPAIDIRAVREVENMRVGVQMNGTVRNMRSSLFSTPSLADGDILSVMITGRPLSEIGTQQDGNALVGAATSLGISQSEGIVNQIQGQLGLDTLSIDSRGDVNDSSLMLGKYITPRIFVRYAVGLFETENSLAIDYSVNDRVKLHATSGQSQSIDLTYTVEQ
ncbi:translocation/assembly module TamB domain-containing protein [Pseudohongiella spirulinae]|uniref:Translocation and assembly module TamB C-terminal domain-containing protein n=1 Tax=Pseudohongiella spirulinae TaxID=1249552 RepID=A0A0S2KBF4_9GAMM|nr:translocation/assembly module TamB domain-containing protein [Pseudohongiella spirulinae]ALO45654.1 hypothetical protein PS2015_985 [Pseudohongiella spirulinae]